MSDSDDSDSLELHDIQWNDRSMSESNSSSSPELHDINWDAVSAMFNYVDHLSQSPQITAVTDNDLPRLKALLESGKSVNVNDNLGFTPLHVSILRKKKEIFDYLLTVENIRIDAESFEGVTPLMLALKDGEEYYARQLLKRGADVNLVQDSGHTPLHASINRSVAVALDLVQKGALINARNDAGETPLFVACDKNKSDHVYMLLYYGADPTIANLKHILPFTSSIAKCDFDVQEVLFDYTFGNGRFKIGLVNYVIVMASQSGFFHKMIEKNVDIFYDRKDFQNLLENLPCIKTEIFRVFIEKYENLARDFFSACNPIKLYKCQYYSEKKTSVDFVDFLCMLSETVYIDEIVNRFKSDVCSSAHSLVDFNLSEDSLTKLLFCLLSYGVNITSYDVNLVFRHYGYGNLFKLLLHQEIQESLYLGIEHFADDFIMPSLIYQPGSKVSSILSSRSFDSDCVRHLNKFFFLEHVLLYFPSNDYSQNFFKVPSLQEFAREAARKFLIEKYNINNSVQFFTVLKWLPICEVIKEILSYERPIYL